MKFAVRILPVMLALFILSNSVSITADETVSPESIKIILNTTVMEVGATQKIKVAVTPANAENYELEYKSSNPQVVTAAIGTLIANATGTADITVNIKGTEIKDTVTVTAGITQESVTVSDIVLTRSYLYLQRYEEDRIYYTILPANATDKNVIFSSLNTSIATVDENGWVYGKKIGNTQIKVQSSDERITKYVDVYVANDDYNDKISDGGISVSRVDIYDGEDEVLKTIELMCTQAKQFTVQIYPDTATDKRIRWSSSDDDIAEVNENGIVKGIKEGTVTIYATAKDNGRRDAITVKIIPYVRYPDSISIAPQEGSVFETGQTVSFTPAFLPIDTTEKNLRWFVYGGCAEVDGTGKMTITGKGKITVKAYTTDWKQSASYEFDAVYSADHFTKYGEGYNVKSNHAVIIEFDSDVSQASAQVNIFAASDENGNSGYMEIRIVANGKRAIITPVNGWGVGINYIFIKGSLTDIYGNKAEQNLKYKFTIRDGTHEKS